MAYDVRFVKRGTVLPEDTLSNIVEELFSPIFPDAFEERSIAESIAERASIEHEDWMIAVLDIDGRRSNVTWTNF